MEKIKLYFAQFKSKVETNTFYKFGITGKSDALKRFEGEENIDKFFNVRILASAIGVDWDPWFKEQEYFKRFKKNFWLPERMRFKGVTEIVKLPYNDVGTILKEFIELKKLWNHKLLDAGNIPWGRADFYKKENLPLQYQTVTNI